MHYQCTLRSFFKMAGPLEAEVASVTMTVTYGETLLTTLNRMLYAGNTIPRLLSMLNVSTDEGGSGLGIAVVSASGVALDRSRKARVHLRCPRDALSSMALSASLLPTRRGPRRSLAYRSKRRAQAVRSMSASS